MRLAFAGTPEFARVALARLHAAGLDVALVLTQPDRPAGRGMKVAASPVKAFALEHGIAVAQPRGLRLDGKFADDAAARARRARRRRARRDRRRRLRPDPAALAARRCRATAASTSTPRCCRAGAARRRSSARSRPATTSPASPSCRWTPASTPAPMLLAESARDRRRRERRRAAGPARRARRRAHRRGARRARQGAARRPAAARGRRHLRRQDHEGRGDDRLARAGGRRSSAACAPSIRRRARAASLAGETITCWRGVVVPGGGAPGEVVAVDGGALDGRLRRGPPRARPSCSAPAAGAWPPRRSCAAGRRASAPSSTRRPIRGATRRSIELRRAAAIFAGDACDASNLRGHRPCSTCSRPPS